MLITGARDFLFLERSPGVPKRFVIYLFTMFVFNLFNSRSNTSIQYKARIRNGALFSRFNTWIRE